MRASESRRSTQTDAPRQRRSWRHPVRGLVLLVAALAFGLGAGCSSGSSKTTCAGITLNGKCEQKCVDSKCATGTRCVVFGELNNACEPACTTNADCPTGRDCEGIRMADGTTGHYCVYLPYSKGGRTGQHEACQSNADCDGPRGFTCIDQSCEQACKKNSDCPDGDVCGSKSYCVADGTGKDGDACKTSTDCAQRSGLECLGGKCLVRCQYPSDCAHGYCGDVGNDDSGKPAKGCVRDNFLRGKGQYGSNCPNGASDCDATNNFACIPPDNEDPLPYCSQLDCKTDTDCPTGYFCSLQGTSTKPCQTTCGVTGDSTQKNCAKATDIGTGKKYQCGPAGLERHMCLKRQFCNSCQTDADCALEPGQICAKDQSGNKICTQLCDPNSKSSCPWGDASTCGIWDKTLNKPTCAHRYGSCKGKGAGCDPCIDDNDCGPNGICTVDLYSGEHFCVNLSDKCSCTGQVVDQSGVCVGGGCPTAAGGKSSLTMNCIGKGASAGICYSAYSINNPLSGDTRLGCWPAK